jgi:transposase
MPWPRRVSAFATCQPSPDLNPIEPCWAKLKTRRRARSARTLAALEAELGPALATVTSQDAIVWFRLAGYGAPN